MRSDILLHQICSMTSIELDQSQTPSVSILHLCRSGISLTGTAMASASNGDELTLHDHNPDFHW